jgi:hypothetical protein
MAARSASRLASIRAFVTRVLFSGARRFRARMIREQLSFPKAKGSRVPRWVKGAAARLAAAGRAEEGRALMERHGGKRASPTFGLGKKTGNTIRSIRYRVDRGPDRIALRAQIGGGAAWYVAQYESKGKIAFGRLFQTVARDMIEEIRAGVQFLRMAGPSAVSVAGSVGADVGGGAADGGERGALLQELGGHYKQKKAHAKLLRASKWKSIVEKYKKNPNVTGPVTAGAGF